MSFKYGLAPYDKFYLRNVLKILLYLIPLYQFPYSCYISFRYIRFHYISFPFHVISDSVISDSVIAFSVISVSVMSISVMSKSLHPCRERCGGVGTMWKVLSFYMISLRHRPFGLTRCYAWSADYMRRSKKGYPLVRIHVGGEKGMSFGMLPERDSVARIIQHLIYCPVKNPLRLIT